MSSFENQELAIFNKGNFQPLNREFMTATHLALEPIVAIQKQYQKMDGDTFLNEFKDSVVAAHLDFDLVNIEKHGFDAKKSVENNIFLEIKQVSATSKTWQATFNDTNEEKANAFMDCKTFLAVGIWHGLSELQCIIYGQHPQIGEYLLKRVRAVQNSSTRSTQNIDVKKLVKDYGFRILPVRDSDSVRQIFRLKFTGQDWWSDAIQ
ncbi:hypothetical protein LNQ82_07195 [Conchiformibius steedae DSM 2580]|uniref:Uncharacterized protein n=1 Tax=Conchiformibius steedae DSM 2580 TaxID=1121352 RepID=A0AAE9KZL3_9NEIS|nr:hypothetical protein [Conchiformibius steedae]QMT34210.1 hypothetical protein H3L98_04280 [Conchiformibius steedae]URD66985.1 hypothetical protein LNQ82_07195 [Conchiformibius steedae DSM 2580]